MNAIAAESPRATTAPQGAQVRRSARVPNGGMVQITIGLIAVAFAESTGPTEWWLPAGAILLSGLAALPLAVRSLRQPMRSLLADHVGILTIAYMVYFVGGAILVPLSRGVSAQASLRYGVDASNSMRAVAVNAIGLGCALIASRFVDGRRLRRRIGSALVLGRSIRSETVAIMFLLIGGASVMYLAPYTLGLREGVTLGIVHTASDLVLVGVVLAVALHGRSARWLTPAGTAVATAYCLLGVAAFNKTMVVLGVLALTIGASLRIGSRRALAVGLGVIVGFLVVFAGSMNAARPVEFPEGAGLDARVEYVRESALSGDALDFAQLYSLWGRFSYLPVQVAAMRLHDFGNGGDSLRLLPWVAVPRALFPQKPIITSSGPELYTKITGNEGSSLGLGAFADGYYNLGWLGVPLFGTMVGIILGFTSKVARMVVSSGGLVWLPMALFGAYMAVRIDGSFISDQWGSFIMILYTLIAAHVVATALGRSHERNVMGDAT